MQVYPIAFDSFGVRSMATFVKTSYGNIFIDPGVALGPVRYGLSPTEEEYEALELSRKNIMKFVKKCKIVIVTHYHYDHHPHVDDEELYKCLYKKTLLIKDIEKNINLSGKKRGRIFVEQLNGNADIEYADSRKFKFGNVIIEFSPAVWHGDVGSKVGRVIMVYIKDGRDTFLFGSDAQGLADPKALKFAIEKNPRLAILDGYPTIFIGWRMSQKAFEKSKEKMKKFLKETSTKTIILDHHILRDIEYKEKMKDVFEQAKRLKKKLLSAAEFYGLQNFFLEAWRKEIHKGERKVDVKQYYRALKKKFKV